MNFLFQIPRLGSGFFHSPPARLWMGLVLLGSPSCALPLAMGPQGLAAARPYQANPQIMDLAPVVVFRNQSGYLSYESASQDTQKESQFIRRISATSCQSGVQIPIPVKRMGSSKTGLLALSLGLGEASLREVLAEAATTLEPGQELSDFTFDLKTLSVLSVWRQTCLVMTAAVTQSRPQEVLPDPPAAILPGPPKVLDATVKAHTLKV